MRFLVDTNVLAYAVNRDCEENRAAVAVLDDWLSGSVPWALTWSIVYEFLRLTTHPRVFRRPLAATDAVAFLTPLLESELVSLLIPTERHEGLLRTTIRELGRPIGNLFHDVHTAVLMREHGVSEIMTADNDFRQFRFLSVTNPIHGDGR